MTSKLPNHFPERTSLLAKIYAKLRNDHPMILQDYLWDYRTNHEAMETRANEIVLVVSEALREGSSN